MLKLLVHAQHVLSCVQVSGARRQQRVLSTAAAAADAAYTAQSLDGIVPYINRKAPQLRSRHLASNPLQGLWEAAAKIALRGELLLTAAVDKQRFAPYIMAALAGLLVGAVSYCANVQKLLLRWLDVKGNHLHCCCLQTQQLQKTLCRCVQIRHSCTRGACTVASAQ